MAKKPIVLDPIDCEVCGKTFTPKDKRRRTCSRSCGGKLGNTKEAREKGRKTRLEKYGDENFNNREKVRKTIQEKYGEQYINTSQVPSIKKKIMETYAKNNGGIGMASKSVAKKVLDSTKEKLGIKDDSITNVGQIDQIKDKIRETTQDKWGGIGFASDELAQKSMDTFKERYGEELRTSSRMKEKRKQALIDKYGVDSPLKYEEFLNKMKETQTKRNGGVGGNSSTIQNKQKENIKRFEDLYNSGEYSVIEIEKEMGLSKGTINRYAKKLGISLRRQNRLNDSWKEKIKEKTGIEFNFEGAIYDNPYKKVDLYNEKHKIAIEVNPTITHSAQPSVFHQKKVEKNYHQERAIEAEKNGWKLIQIFDWDNEEEIIELIDNICNPPKKINARDCIVEEIPQEISLRFINENHRKGIQALGSISFGLKKDGELVQVLCLSKERFMKSEPDEYEIIRMCSKKGLRVNGGASKLMKAFIESEYKPLRIKTFVDYSKGQGNVYKKMGMQFVGFSNLNGYYANIDTGEAHKESTVERLFGDLYKKENLTRQQYMNSKRFYLIFDAGNKIFEWTRDEK